MAAARDIGRGDGDVVAGATHELYNRYGRQIYAYCLHQLSSREEAEDAVQSTFLNAFRGLQRGTVAHSEQAWLFKIAHNVCLSRQTSSGRRRRVETPNDFEILQEIIPSPPRSGADELIGLEAALEAMPENQRRAILLREWQGLSYREIGAELELSQAAVEMLIFRARRSLASALEPAETPQAPLAGPRLDLGTLLTGLKSALTGGAAVKLVAAAAAASTVGIAVQPVERTFVHRIAARRVAVTATAPAVVTAAPAARSEAAAGPRTAAPVLAAIDIPRVHARADVVRAVAPAAFHPAPADAPAAAPAVDTVAVQALPAPAPSAPAPSAPAVSAPAANATAPAAPPSAAASPAGPAPAHANADGGRARASRLHRPVSAPVPVLTLAALAASTPPASSAAGGRGHGLRGSDGGVPGDGDANGRAPQAPVAPVPPATPVPVQQSSPPETAPVLPATPLVPPGAGTSRGGWNGKANGWGNGYLDPQPAPASQSVAPAPPAAPAPPPVAVPPAPAPAAHAAHGSRGGGDWH